MGNGFKMQRKKKSMGEITLQAAPRAFSETSRRIPPTLLLLHRRLLDHGDHHRPPPLPMRPHRRPPRCQTQTPPPKYQTKFNQPEHRGESLNGAPHTRPPPPPTASELAGGAVAILRVAVAAVRDGPCAALRAHHAAGFSVSKAHYAAPPARRRGPFHSIPGRGPNS